MIGDTDSDVLAGHAAGCRAVLIEHPGSAHKRAGAARPDLVASSLADAAAHLLRELALAPSRERPTRDPRG
jgi:phosphoglycolate phosphatase-like HAD superfamily hydrolase